MRRAIILVLSIALVAALVVVAGGFAFGGDSDDPAVDLSPATTTPTPTPTATPTPSPTPSPTPTPAISEPNRYREAIAARDAGDLASAAAALRQIADEDGALAPYASFRLAQVLASSGDPDGAVTAFEAALSDPALPASLRPIAHQEGAAALLMAGRDAEAIEWLGLAASDVNASATQRTSARWDRAQLLYAAGDPTWTDDALAIVAGSPGHPSASLALDALEEAEVAAAPLSAAYTRYLARQNGLATERYTAILDGGPDAATAAVAWFYLGALAERLPDRPGAIEAYTTSLDVDPTGIRADDAAYWRGRVAEEEQDFEAAAQYYDALLASYPSSPFVADGELRGALALFESGDEAGALERLAAIAQARGFAAAAASRWYDELAGAEARVEAGVPSATEIDPRSFAAILERSGDELLALPVVEPVPATPDDGAILDEWLIEHYGVSTGTSAIGEDEVLEIIQILVDAGERSVGRAIFLEHLDRVESDPHAVARVSERVAAIGLPDAAMLGSLRLLGGLSTADRLETPRALERLTYPAPWPDLVESASEEFEVPPLLLLALIRQESAFEPDVVSVAGAIGLTQVIPSTGVLVARDLEEEWRGPLSLTEPETALRYGASYLSTQLERFDGNVFAALAAYNAGPLNAERWLESQVAEGPDGYVQTIDFEETRRYVTHVIEQYGWYRYVYGLADLPAIR